jgi:carbonic anhydrase
MRFITYAALIAGLILFSFGVSFAGGHGHSAHWGYEGEIGPAHWGDLSPEYSACKEGKMQSPVDITGAVKADLDDIEFNYNDVPLMIINNGHAIQVNYAGDSSIEVNGKEYKLLQFHFHGPSENTVNGKPYDMEAHLVHKSSDGELAVVAVFMKKGKKNDFIQTLWKYMPEEEGKERSVRSVKINASQLLPADKTYYSFTGSLTTPPCSEGVKWMVMKTPIEVSAKQIAKFSSIFEMNARPVQPLNGRIIKVSN